MYICHFLRDGSGSCNGQTFLTVQYYATGFAVIALFSLHVNRLATFVSQLVYWILTCVMLVSLFVLPSPCIWLSRSHSSQHNGPASLFLSLSPYTTQSYRSLPITLVQLSTSSFSPHSSFSFTFNKKKSIDVCLLYVLN